MITYDPNSINHQQLHSIMLGSIAPRPIAFVSTVDKDGNPNLSPFSFFNAFGVNPSTLIFSPSRRGRDATNKHTLENIKEVAEVVINIVNYEMVEQVSLASTEYAKGVNEFIKAGLTSIPSEKVKPFRVKESPVQYECKVRQIIETGEGGGAANLVICEIVLVHVNEAILDENGSINAEKIRLIGRMGGDLYVKAFGDNLFKVAKPVKRMGIGIDQLPENIKNSIYLNGNELGKLGNTESLPGPQEIEAFKKNPDYVKIWLECTQANEREKTFFTTAKDLLAKGLVWEAFCLLMAI